MKRFFNIQSLATALPLLFALSSPAHAGLGDLLPQAGDLLNLGQSSNLLQGKDNPGLSTPQIDAGLKEALGIGAERAVALLGKRNGFLKDPSVRIPLPTTLEKVAQGLRSAGQGKYVNQFERSVNRAAEQAIPQTLAIVQQTVQSMTLQDARAILSGGDDAATRFLQERAGQQLHQAIKPIVAQATDGAGATAAYKRLISQAPAPDGLLDNLGNNLGLGDLATNIGSSLGQLPTKEALDLDEYVTNKTLDGLFLKLAAEEQAIRQNPAARTTQLLKQVFGQ